MAINYEYDDSFDSFESGTESDGDMTEGGQLQSTSDTTLTIPTVDIPRQLEVHDQSREVYVSISDQEESHTNSVKGERSPKPKKKFKPTFKKPNIGNIKQKFRKKRKDVTVFGVSIDIAIQRSHLATDGVQLPTVFRQCIDLLEDVGLDHQGIYRLPGVKSKIEEAKSRFDKDDDVDLSDYDPNIVASLLKQYLRELPEPLISSVRFESAATLPKDEQYAAFDEALDDVSPSSKLLLSWLLEHMRHIVEKSDVNKMSLPNMVIVFSPTLQISAPVLHALFNNALDLFGEIELKKYIRPVLSENVSEVKLSHLSHINTLETEEEITAELERLAAVLEGLHNKMAGKYDQRDENIWELQRAITLLRRKKKVLHRGARVQPGSDDEFMKTLLLMQATLTAEKEELLSKKDELHSAIRQETELIEEYKRKLEILKPRTMEVNDESSTEESGDEGELAKKIAALKWHGKELEIRKRDLIENLKEEGDLIMQLKVKLKVLPLKQKLNGVVDE